MKTFARIKFWSLLGFGMLFLSAGTYLLITGGASKGFTEALLIAGLGQLAIFYFLLFYLNRGKIRKSRKSD